MPIRVIKYAYNLDIKFQHYRFLFSGIGSLIGCLIGPLIVIIASMANTDGLNGVTVINRVTEDYKRDSGVAPERDSS